MRDAIFDVGMFAVTDCFTPGSIDTPQHGQSHGIMSQSRAAHASVQAGFVETSGLASGDALGGASRPLLQNAGRPSLTAGEGVLAAFASCVVDGHLKDTDGARGTGGGGTRGGELRTVVLPASGGLVGRSTLATATNGTVALPLFLRSPSPAAVSSGASSAPSESAPSESDSPCPEMEGPAKSLRRTVDDVGRAYARLLDRLVHGVTAR